MSIFIIAEISANHNGSIEVAKNTIRAAKEAGADCVTTPTEIKFIPMFKYLKYLNRIHYFLIENQN